MSDSHLLCHAHTILWPCHSSRGYDTACGLPAHVRRTYRPHNDPYLRLYRVVAAHNKKKTSTFKHTAWSEDSILCYLRYLFEAGRFVFFVKATWRHAMNPLRWYRGRCHVTPYRSPGCADVLRGARADLTDFSYMTLMDTSVVKHNMLKKLPTVASTSTVKRGRYNCITMATFVKRRLHNVTSHIR